MAVKKGLIVLGFGGHARSVADVALSSGYDRFVFVDKNARVGETFLDFVVQKAWPETIGAGWSCLPASGVGIEREAQMEAVARRGWAVATLIAQTATIGVGAEIGAGTFVAHHAHVGPMARVGRACIINTGCSVEHESVVGEFTHISVNTTIAGRSKVGKHCFIGAGATIIDGIEVTDEVVVGAGSVVVKPISSPGTFVGCPARMIG
ncbi:NeuD/PglB/VioB family sugar acetyltransferase [Thiocapsa marina]|uniref:Sugar O-acyltransferase, sialic acid O-acetyltransferase NeuD family n=1 Tax=Thiocapsa marina 5811 TaxID=768671 RepID=F9U6Y2_9GAMM|nr:NeuD/PglB/VioB family sugar acetyltransferase [Thiocapsa marina]EGV20008.1 sugar O-acyltransferase, sialic acid O-acetyltransferase NeuD family [Thiocapsa marina 5811]